MQNASEIANTIIVANSNLKSLAPRKTCEKVGGIPASKLKFTSATYLTFRHNLTVSDELFKNVIEILNKKLSVALKDIETAEEKNAEEELMKKITPEKEAKPVNENVEAIKIVRKINNATRKEKIDTVLSNNNVLLTNPNKYLDENGKLHRNASSKAIMIPAILQSICLEIAKNQNKYGFVEKEENDPNVNWKDIFASVIVNDEKENQIEDVKNIIDDEYTDKSTKITMEEFEKRKLQANIGEELKDIRGLLNGFGQSTPFREGLIKRETPLKRMLEEIGMFKVTDKVMNNYSSGKTTEIQKVIDEVTGYKEPLTSEEHEKKEKEINDYYSNPDVQNLIDDLRLKNKLFDMNKEEAYEKIDEAERIDNERRMEFMSNRIISGMKTESDFEKFNPSSVENKVDKNKEKNYILNGAKEQARLLEAKSNREFILNSAKEEAKMLNDRNEINELARHYAEDILRFNNLIDSAKKYAKDIFEHDLVLESAEKYAIDISEFNKAIDLSKVYAQDIYNKYVIKDMAEEYAKYIYEYSNIVDMAKKYAKDIFDGNKIISGAEEQAKALNEMNKIIDAARIYAQDIFNENMMIDIKNGAEEQAEILFAKNKIASIIEKSENRLKDGSVILNNDDEQREKIKETLDEIVARSYSAIERKQENTFDNKGADLSQNDEKNIEETVKNEDIERRNDDELENRIVSVDVNATNANVNATNDNDVNNVQEKTVLNANNEHSDSKTDATTENFEKNENLNMQHSSTTDEKNAEYEEKRKDEIERARKIVDDLLGMFKAKPSEDDYIDMHKSAMEQAKMLQTSNSDVKEHENASVQTQENKKDDYEIFQMNVRYLSQLYPAKKIKLPGRNRVDNIINVSNHYIENEQSRTLRRA